MTEYRSAPLTALALRPDVLRITITPFIRHLPPDAVGGSTVNDMAPRPLTLHWRDLSVTADVPTKKGDRSSFRGFLRHRGVLTRTIFEEAKAAPGDVVVFEQLASHEYRLHVEKPDGTRISGGDAETAEEDRIRSWSLRETRPGQQKFRRKIAERDGLKCAITGCTVAEVLDAAHLEQRAPRGSDDPSNGLILRVDLHRLMDAGLLRIDPDLRVIEIDPGVDDPGFQALHGAEVTTAADLNRLRS